MRKGLLAAAVLAVLVPLHARADTTYTVNGFSASSDRTTCVATASVSLSNKSVTRTAFTGTAATSKPTNVNLKVGSRSDDTTPSGTDGNWSGLTNSFNGSSFSSGTWTITVKPSKALPGSVKATDVKPTPATVKPASAAGGPELCNHFNGFKLTFQHS